MTDTGDKPDDPPKPDNDTPDASAPRNDAPLDNPDTRIDDEAELDSVLSQIEALAQARPAPRAPEYEPEHEPERPANIATSADASSGDTTDATGKEDDGTAEDAEDGSATDKTDTKDDSKSGEGAKAASEDKADGDAALPVAPVAPPSKKQDRLPRRARSAGGPGSHIWNVAALLVLVGVAAIAGFTFRDYGMGWDDYAHSEYGELLRQFYLSGFEDRRALSFVNLFYYGGGFDLGAALLAKYLPLTLFETRRLCGAVIGIATLVVTWRLGRRVAGRAGGFFALVALAAMPVFYGHMFMNPKDAPFAFAMVLMLYGLVRVFDDYPRPSAATIVILGVGAGLAVGTRVLAGFWIVAALIAVVPLLLADFRSSGALGRIGRTLLRIVPAIVIAVIVMAAVWPWVATGPMNLVAAIAYFDVFFEKPWPELFNGAVIQVSHMPRAYLPTLFALKMPEIALVLVAGGVIGTLIAVFSARVTPRRKSVLLLVLLAAFLPLIVALAGRPAFYNGIRHFVFLLPAMAVVAGLAASWVVMRAATRGRLAVIVAALLMLAPFALPVMAMKRLHPFEYVYFNDASGGVRAAEGRFMIDYWGLSFKQASEGLRALLARRGEAPSGGRAWKVAVCGPTRAAEVFLGARFAPGSDLKGADFAITLGEFYCREPDLPVTLTVIRDGHVFARVYDVRGMTLSPLDRFPPVRAPN